VNLVITGGCGYIGSVLMHVLSDLAFQLETWQGLNVTIASSCKGGNGLSYLPYQNIYNFTDVDLSKKIPRCIKEADAVIHLASMVGFPACDANPDGSELLNVGVTQRIAEAMKPEAKLIFASTASVYGDVENLVESAVCNPKSRYAEQKLRAESFVSQRHHTIFRFTTAFGLSPSMRYDLLLHTLIIDALKNKTIKLFEPSAIRSLVHVNDIANHLIDSLYLEAYKNQTFNLGFAKNQMTKADIALLISKYTGAEILQDELHSDPEQRRRTVNFDKLFNLNPDYKPVTIENGIKSLVEYKSLYLK